MKRAFESYFFFLVQFTSYHSLLFSLEPINSICNLRYSREEKKKTPAKQAKNRSVVLIVDTVCPFLFGLFFPFPQLSALTECLHFESRLATVHGTQCRPLGLCVSVMPWGSFRRRAVNVTHHCRHRYAYQLRLFFLPPLGPSRSLSLSVVVRHYVFVFFSAFPLLVFIRELAVLVCLLESHLFC